MLEQLKQDIRAAQAPQGVPIKIVAIDGHGGSGKTTLAKLLSNVLRSEVIHTDDFASWEHPLDWWPRMISEVLGPIKRGVTKLNYKRGAWYKNHNPTPVKDQPVTPIMILEGVSSSRKEFREYLAYSIWVETPLETCLKRGIERDLESNEAGKSHGEIVADWNKWHSYEKKYVKRDDPKGFADIIVDGTKKLA